MRAAFAPRSLTPVWFVVLLTAAATGAQVAGAATARLADEILEVNVRPAGCSTNAELLAERLQVCEYALESDDGSRQWVMTDLKRLRAPSTSGAVTLVYVHGNKVDRWHARRRSMCVYRSMARHLAVDQPVRFVIFSWPATEVRGFLNDFRVKAARTRPVGWQLAWVLAQLPADSQASLLGYSYGARIATGAAHLLAGGELSGLRLDDSLVVRRSPMRVAFLAPANHAHWLGPNQYHGLAMSQMERLVVLNNELDPAMRFYRFVEKCSNPQAMGLHGPTCLSAEQRERVTCYDCTRCVGRSHDLFRYLATGRTMAGVWKYLAFAD